MGRRIRWWGRRMWGRRGRWCRPASRDPLSYVWVESKLVNPAAARVTERTELYAYRYISHVSVVLSRIDNSTLCVARHPSPCRLTPSGGSSTSRNLHTAKVSRLCLNNLVQATDPIPQAGLSLFPVFRSCDIPAPRAFIITAMLFYSADEHLVAVSGE